MTCLCQGGMLASALLHVYNDKDEFMELRCLFDSGSDRSYITRRVADQLSLQGQEETLTIDVLGGRSPVRQSVQRVQAWVSASDAAASDYKQQTLLDLTTLTYICAPVPAVLCNPALRWKHLSQITLADCYPRQASQVDLLIGQDNYWKLVTGKVRRGRNTDPVAMSTGLGWVICGIHPEASKEETSIALSAGSNIISNVDLAALLRSFHSTEVLGIAENEGQDMSLAEKRTMEHYDQTTTFDGARYTVRITYKIPKIPLMDNFRSVYIRMCNVERGLLKNPDKAKLFSDAINEYVIKGYAEEVTNDMACVGPVFYFPYQAVYKQDRETTKVRIVFDASAEGPNGVSFNDAIEIGPPLQPDLSKVLLRFRCNRIALVGDISKMFLQVILDERDRDAHRYVWRNLDVKSEVKIFRMKVVTFGVAESPFHAIATTQRHARKYLESTSAAQEILHNMYVDDLATGGDDEQSVVTLRRDLSQMMLQGGFPLTKWVSNSPAVLSTIPVADRAAGGPIFLSEKEEAFNEIEPDANKIKTLGVRWNPQQDVFEFAGFVDLGQGKCSTKRELSSLAAKLFDPFGFISPFVVRAKILMQDLWLNKADWDEDLTEEVLAPWHVWQGEISEISRFTVPRWVGRLKFADVQIHAFGDASLQAYSACVYMRVRKEDETTSHLLMAKTRVKPLKPMSVARLELLALLCAVHLSEYVIDALGLDKSVVRLWTDSLTVQQWVQKPASTWRTFVANRVAAIQVLADPGSISHVPGVLNPADWGSRGVSAEQLCRSTFWKNGPEFLILDECFWPGGEEFVPPKKSSIRIDKIDKSPAAVSDDVDAERRQHATAIFAITSSPFILKPEEYSSNSRLIRITAYVLRFVNVLLWKTKSQVLGISPHSVGDMKQTAWLTTLELNTAQQLWIRISQQNHFCEEWRLLKDDQIISKGRLVCLSPFLEKESSLLRVGGRLQFSNLIFEARHPIILANSCPIVEKMIMAVHCDNMHCGPEHTLSLMRRKYWLLRGRSEIKRVLRTCLVCHKLRVSSLGQKMAPLPEQRVQPSDAFDHVGVDFAGPIMIRSGDSPIKSWIVLFTCMSSRAVHLELVTDMTTESFLLALRRLFARRGLCKTLWSDNAKTFKKADKELSLLWKKLDRTFINESLAQKNIEWKFIVERAPWWGGFWERMVRSVKTALKKVLGRSLLSYIEFYTMLTEAEAMVNSRPLTIVMDNLDDPSPISPALLTLGRPLEQLPDESFAELSKVSDIGARHRYRQKLRTHLWKRWKNEYMAELTTFNKWFLESVDLKVGDIVLINNDEKAPRVNWPLGKVVSVHRGADGLVRSALLKTERGEVNRAIQRLHLLLEADQAVSKTVIQRRGKRN